MRSGSAPGSGTSSRTRDVTRIDPRSEDALERALRLVGCATTEERRVKIGITCYPTYGGSGAVATELGIALAARGHEVHFITYQQPFRLPVVPAARLLPRSGRAAVSAVRVSRRTISRSRCACTRWCAITISNCSTCTTPSRTRPARGSRARCSRTGPRACASSPRSTAPTSRSSGRTRASRRSRNSRSSAPTGSRRSPSTCARRRTRAFGCSACAVDVIPNFIDPARLRSRALPAAPARAGRRRRRRS